MQKLSRGVGVQEAKPAFDFYIRVGGKSYYVSNLVMVESPQGSRVRLVDKNCQFEPLSTL